MIEITEEDALEMYRILKEITKHHYQYDTWACCTFRGPSCPSCTAINRAYEIIADIESGE
jgi:hypothetical protein